MNVWVAGAGIGGLTAALSLDAAGMRDVRVAEAVPEILPLGVGINVLPHAVRELEELGLRKDLQRIGLEVLKTSYYDQHGNHIATMPRGRAAGHTWPQYSVHRGALQMLLLEQVRQRLGVNAVRTGTAVDGFRPVDNGVTLSLAGVGEGSATEEHAEVLVGADGVKSTLRALLYPDEGEPVWNECLMFRGVAHLEHEFLEQNTVLFAGHHDQRFMLYPIRDMDGRRIMNWGCTLRVGGELPEHSNWNRRVDASMIRDAYSGWRFGSIDVRTIIDSADAIFVYPMVDRDPLSRWSFGRVTLLGDAAHPMYPSGSNGASQAILDARTLAQELTRHADPSDALCAYQDSRLRMTAEVVLANRKMADMRLLQVVHERAPHGFDNIEAVISQAEITEIMQGYQFTAGFEPSQLNARASYSVGSHW